MIEKEGKSRAIFDLGLSRSIPKSKAYAFLKGVIDAGVEIPCSESMFPEESRILGKHLKKNIPAAEIKNKIQKD